MRWCQERGVMAIACRFESLGWSLTPLSAVDDENLLPWRSRKRRRENRKLSSDSSSFSSSSSKRSAFPSLDEIASSFSASSHSQGEGEELALDENGEVLMNKYPKRFVVPRAEGAGNVRAYYIAKKINVVPMFQKMYGRQKNWLEVDSLIISFGEERSTQKKSSSEPFGFSSSQESVGDTARNAPPEPPPPPRGTIRPPLKSTPSSVMFSGQKGQSKTWKTLSSNQDISSSYAVFFDYGAVAFFNCDERLQTESIAQAESFCVGYLDTGGTSGSDDFTVEVDPSIESWSAFKANRLLVQKLDINNIRVISSVLAQSVALGHFERVVDGMLQSFEQANSEEAGTLDSNNLSRTKMLFKMLRESNSVLAEVIVKLGVLDRTRMKEAWRYAKYGIIWEGLRDEFEIDARWDILNTKADYLQQNMRFFLELIHSQKGERLEWMIIILISLELLVSVLSLILGTH